MATKLYTFEADQLPLNDISIELEYTYSYDPGVYDQLPENCYPAEEECEIKLQKDWEQRVFNAYLNDARAAIKKIESNLVPNLEFNNAPREWAQESAEY